MSLKELYEKYKDKLFDKLVELAVRIESLMRQNSPVGATGNLRNSINAKFVPWEQGVAVEIGSPLEYASYVEFGTRPHNPPFEPIRLWVERVIQPHVKVVKIKYEETEAGIRVLPRGRSVFKDRERRINKVTWAVIRKIKRFGTKEKRWVRNSLDSLGLEYNVKFFEGGAIIDVDYSKWIENEINKIEI